MDELTITAAHPGAGRVLSDGAKRFVAELERRFGERRLELLSERRGRQARFDAGERPGFLTATAAVREGDWQVPPAPGPLVDRRVEITGPTERKLMINALNSGAQVFMADLEDACSPTWDNVVSGQVNLIDAVRRTIEAEAGGHTYRVGAAPATLVFRPRGLHLEEKHARTSAQAVSASLFDAGLFLFHNAAETVAGGSGPYLYLPKLEAHEEAAWWEDVCAFSEGALGLDEGAVRVTVLIETVTAAFEMDEILYELRRRACALNAGRWDYIFSIAKRFREDPSFVLPDRQAVTMTVPFMRAYTQLLVATCHRRGAHAIGGMAAVVPNRRRPDVTARALEAVAEDKRREAGDGFDGTWVAHPDLVETAEAEFRSALSGRPNQLERRPALEADAEALLSVARTPGEVTRAGLKRNVSVGLRYLCSWLSGGGAVAIDDLMEDVATAEICRAQVWQWIRHDVKLDDGEAVTAAGVRRLLDEEGARLEGGGVAPALVGAARKLFEEVASGADFPDFLTVPGYRYLD